MKKSITVFISLFILGLIISFCYRLIQVQRLKKVTFLPQKLTFKLKPPGAALVGSFMEIGGGVKKRKRDEDKFKQVDVKEEILQGEAISTASLSWARVEFKNFLRITLDSETEIAFVDLIPSEFLIKQTEGLATYELINNTRPICVRSLNSLFSLNSGIGKVTTDKENGQIIIEIISGNGKIAIVDLENQTHVGKIEESQGFLIDDNQRTITPINY